MLNKAMHRLGTFLAVFAIHSAALGWSGPTHDLIARESLKSVAKQWHLEEPLTVTPFDHFLKKLAQEKPEIQTREDFAKWLQINPSAKFDLPKREEKIGGTTNPYEILSRYASKPDDGRDKDLPYDKLEQFWFGSGTKTVSQAFRHMEKPAFNLLHPLNTFGFPLGKIGQATQRAQIYFDLALLAHRLGESYWAWNFLGCALHYIQDLQQPYHSAQLPPPLAWEGFKGYFQWGRKEGKGMIKAVTHVTANAHHYFEGYVDYLVFKDDSPIGNLWRNALRGKETLPMPNSSIHDLAQNIRDFSNHFSYDTIQATFKLTGKSLLGPRLYKIDEEDQLHPEDPLPFLNPNSEERVTAASQISQIVLESFGYQGKAMRTVIRQFLDQTEQPK